jgi:hypothetical protein
VLAITIIIIIIITIIYPLLYNGFQVVKWLGRRTDHPPEFGAEVKESVEPHL